MWYAMAVWLAAASGPQWVPVTDHTFQTRSDCIEWVIENTDFDEMVVDQWHLTVLDDGVKDQFGVACVTPTTET